MAIETKPVQKAGKDTCNALHYTKNAKLGDLIAIETALPQFVPINAKIPAKINSLTYSL